MSARPRCPACVEAVETAVQLCPSCATAYHPACLQDIGCLVPGCRRTAARLPAAPEARLESCILWRPSLATFLIAFAILWWHDARWDSALRRIQESLATIAWLIGSAGVIGSGWWDLGWKIPAGQARRPDRMGTIALMLLGFVALLLGIAVAMELGYRRFDVALLYMLVLAVAAVALTAAGSGLWTDERPARARIAAALSVVLVLFLGLAYSPLR